MNKLGLSTDQYERIQTRNHMGFMFLKSSPLRAAFLEHIQPGDSVADIGCAYGQDSLLALEKGAHVLAVDLDSEHLACLQGAVPLNQMDRLTLHCGHYPGEFLLPVGEFSAVLLSRLLIFLTLSELTAALRNVYDSLKVGGRLFVVNATPFSDRWSKIAELHKRHVSIAPETPLIVPNLWDLLPPLSKYLPERIMLFDNISLPAVLRQAGFIVEAYDYWAHDGTVDIWAVGSKKI